MKSVEMRSSLILKEDGKWRGNAERGEIYVHLYAIHEFREVFYGLRCSEVARDFL